ncbi:MAG TPA: KpsF/GutQ family sugar-phosphate isomerase [Bacteroidota bacterium]|nr:KpsF/GutQ family sugar-phosphate isomerase [Bacteroidota bacterium]
MDSVIQKGKQVIQIEAEAVAALLNRIDAEFVRAVNLLYECKGRVIVTGMGKSGIIARKIVATLNSTGTAAMFLHPSDAIHGDLGAVRNDDVVVCISKSGDTGELHHLLSVFKRMNVPVIAMVGNLNSSLAKSSDVVLDVSVKEEACPHDLAPTASTTATLAMGDALAIALLDKRNFTAEEFAMYHPGGNLGKRLTLKISEFMVKGKGVPIVSTDIPVRDAILEMTSKRLGATCVVDASGVLVGIITDGDLRRMLQKSTDISGRTAGEVMTKNPKTIYGNILASAALQELETHNITQLIVVDSAKKPVGMVHLHELVKAGLGGEQS